MAIRPSIEFVVVFLLLCPRFSVGLPDCSREKNAEVLILGAGFAGLSAGRTLMENGINDFLIIDQGDKIGGRAQSVKFGGATVELGPQWIFFANPFTPGRHPILSLAVECNVAVRRDLLGSRGIKLYRNGEDITLSPEVLLSLRRYTTTTTLSVLSTITNGLHQDEDLSVSGGLKAAGWLPRSSIDQLIEFANIDFPLSEPAATLGYRDTFDTKVTSERQRSFGGNSALSFIVADDDVGYVGLAQCIADKFLTEDDPRLVLETSVKSVAWSDDCVCVRVEQGGEEKEYCGKYAIITFSIGVLQNRAVRFEPDLPLNIHLGLNKLQMGRFLKVYALFNETFWDKDIDFIFVVDEINGRDYYPMFAPWGEFFSGKSYPIIQAYIMGDAGERISYQNKEITKRQIGEVMKSIYGEKASDPIDVIMGDFIRNPYYFGNLGGVSTPGVTNETYKLLNEPIGNIFLAGDGVAYSFHSSTNGAVISGQNAGNRVINLMKQPPKITFINDSPIVNGTNVSAQFSVSKEVSLVHCSLDGGSQRTDCSSGTIEYINLSQGRHRLKVIARNAEPTDRGVETRSFFINDRPHCAVQLINGGIEVFEGSVSVEFVSAGLPATSFSCNVNSVRIFPCVSPLRLSNVKSGIHRIRIRPVCDGDKQIGSFRFRIP